MSFKRDASGSVSLIGHAKVKAIKKEPANKSPPKSNKPTISQAEYTVEKIIGKRFWNGRPQLLIKWFGYPEEESTWEPQENMGNCIELLTDFEAELHKKQMKQETIIQTEGLRASPASARKQIKKKSCSKLYTNLVMKMDKLQIKPSSAPLKRKPKQEVTPSPEMTNKTFNALTPVKPKAKQEVKLPPEMERKSLETLSPLKRKPNQEVKESPEVTSKTSNISTPLKPKAKQEVKLAPEMERKALETLSPLKRKRNQEVKVSPEVPSKTSNISTPLKSKEKQEIKLPPEMVSKSCKIVLPLKRKLSSYEHRSFLDLSSDSSDNGETIPLRQETEKQSPLKQSPLKQFSASDKASGAYRPSLNAGSKYNTLEFIKEQARKWRSKKGKQHQKLRDTPTSRPGKPMKPRNLDDSIESVMKRLHYGTDDRQENLPSTPTTPKCQMQPNSDGNYHITRSGNKRDRWAPWRVSPRTRKHPYGLARGRPLDKVIHHFKMGDLVFLFVNWQGMSVTDVILLDNLIDIYPQQIIEYMETIKIVIC